MFLDNRKDTFQGLPILPVAEKGGYQGSPLKVLHLFSMAGVAEMLCNERSIVLQLKNLDPFGFSSYYNKTFLFDDIAQLLNAASNASYNADYIVLHDFVEYYREINPEKLVLFFHGTKLRDILKNDPEFNRIKDNFRTIVSTPDLLEILPNAFYLPVPVDTILFKENYKNRNKKFLTINRNYQIEHIKDKILSKYPNTEYRNRQEKIIPYNEMPNLLNEYTDYVDWKFDYSKPIPQTINATSTTGLQALSCGLNVWRYDGTKLDRKILQEHQMDIVRDKFMRFLAKK